MDKTCGTCANLVRLSPEDFSKDDACYVCYHIREVSQGGYPVWPVVLYGDKACKEHYVERKDA